MIENLKKYKEIIENSEQEIERLNETIKDLEQRGDAGFDHWNGEKDYLELQIEKEQEKIEEAKKEMENLFVGIKGRKNELELSITSSEQEIDRIKTALTELDQRADAGFDHWNGEKDYLELQLEKEEQALAEAKEELEYINNEPMIANNLSESKETTLTKYEDEIVSLEQEIEQHKAALTELDQRADAGFDQWNGEKDYLELQIEEKSKKIEENKAIINNYNSVKETIEKINEIKASIEGVNSGSELEELNRQLAAERKKLSETMDLLPDDLKNELEKMHAEIKETSSIGQSEETKEEPEINYEDLDLESLKKELEKEEAKCNNALERTKELAIEKAKKEEAGNLTPEEAIEYDKKINAEYKKSEKAREKIKKIQEIKDKKEEELKQSAEVELYEHPKKVKAGNKELAEKRKIKISPEKMKKLIENAEKKPKGIRRLTPQKGKGEPAPSDMVTLENKQQLTLYGVLQKIRGDVITKENQEIFQSKNVKRYKRSNLKVSDQFKKELNSGNTIYNIVHFLPNISKSIIGLGARWLGKLFKNKDSDKLISQLRENVQKLTPEEKELLFQEYKGSNLLTTKQPAAIDMVIQETINQYALGKVQGLNDGISKSYDIIIDAIRRKDAIVASLKEGELSAEDKEKLIKANDKCDVEAAAAIDFITKARKDANNILSGGLHGFSEDLKAKASKMNFVGMRFSKESFDPELDNKLAELEEKYKYSSSPSEKLAAFKEFEMLHAKHTIIEEHITGQKSVGEKYYSPLAKQLNYNPDPFVRDILTSIALATAATAGVNSFITERHINVANEHNTEAIAYANEAGDKIVAGQDTIMEGLTAQTQQNNLTMAGIVERTVADKNVWETGSADYQLDDAAGHLFYNETFAQTQNDITTIANDYASGTIDKASAIELLGDVANNSQVTLGNVVKECLPYLEEYAKNHPQFDLTAFKGTMNGIIENPNAISDMNQLIVEISGYGEGLSKLTAEAIPSDMLTTLAGAVSSVALAAKVSNQATKYMDSQKYGNHVTEGINELVEEEEKREAELSDMFENEPEEENEEEKARQM